ncbi:MAG: ABC transporter permease [Clostridia bacterium]|nr:ABC transporter permease [Clostridia bacterium]
MNPFRKRSKQLTREQLRRRMLILLVLAGLLCIFALVAPYLTPNDPNEPNAAYMNAAPCKEFPLGADRYGRCVLSRIMIGARTSIFAAVALVFVTFVVGSLLGILCGYYGGILDTVIMRIADIFLAFPQMVLAIAVAGVLGGSLLNAMIALGISGWTLYARLARTHTMALKNEPFVIAAKMNGSSGLNIMLRHLLPNMIGPLTVNAATQIGTNMIGIAGLSFLGLGVVPPKAEWGSMINEARAYIQLAPWSVFAPAVAVIVTVMLFNYLGDAVRDYSDVSEAKG